jgi:sec-independent protein translocase protein TatA
MNLGPAEILVIIVVALLVFGPKRLPEVSRQVGGALRELRKVQETVRSEIDAVINAEPEAPAASSNRREADHTAEPDHTETAPDLDTPPDAGVDGPPGSAS